MAVVLCSRKSLKDHDIMNAPEQTILVTVNIVGAAGRGVALAMKMRYPKVYQAYRKICLRGKFSPNSIFYIKVSDTQQLLLFPTKTHWKYNSPPQLIIDNLNILKEKYRQYNIESLALTPLGMLNGKLHGKDKSRVWEHMTLVLDEMDINCTIYTD